MVVGRKEKEIFLILSNLIYAYLFLPLFYFFFG